MEPKDPLPCLQEPANDPYPESDEPSPNLLTLLPQDPFQNYFPIYTKFFRVVSSIQIFRLKCYTFISSMLATFPAHLILLDLITVIIFREAHKL